MHSGAHSLPLPVSTRTTKKRLNHLFTLSTGTAVLIQQHSAWGQSTPAHTDMDRAALEERVRTLRGKGGLDHAGVRAKARARLAAAKRRDRASEIEEKHREWAELYLSHAKDELSRLQRGVKEDEQEAGGELPDDYIINGEINPIELVWGRSKYMVRKLCDYKTKTMLKSIPLSYAWMDVALIEKYVRKVDVCHTVYADRRKYLGRAAEEHYDALKKLRGKFLPLEGSHIVMSSAGDEERTAASGEQIRSPVEEGHDAELASLQRQISQLAALVEESVKKEPGSVVADAASSGGWVAATEGQQAPPLPLGGGEGFLQQQARDSGQGPRQLLEGGWASRSGANPVRPAGVGPGIGPDYGEAKGLNPPGEIPVIRGNGEFLDGYSSSHRKRVTVNAPRLEGESCGHGYDSWRKSLIQAAKTVGLDDQLIGNNGEHAPVGNPNVPSSELYRLQYTSDEVQRGLQAFHFVTTAIVSEADKAIMNKCETATEILAELDKIYDPESQGSKQALMTQMINFTIPTHSNSNPIEHVYSLELLYARLRKMGLNAEQPFVLAHFVGSLPPEYQQAKFLLETATALDRAEIVRIVSTVHASLPEGRKASKGQRG
ncbi:unnamed protein product [Ectocarpus sp. CCAP 1310/34]|nr:unnamed protein product [Ectocarpus sp. CCAP 1310/34]